MTELESLKSFIDLGGVFILALLMVWGYFKTLKSIDENMVKVLALLTILVKANTNFNGVETVLNKTGQKVVDLIVKAETHE